MLPAGDDEVVAMESCAGHYRRRRSGVVGGQVGQGILKGFNHDLLCVCFAKLNIQHVSNHHRSSAPIFTINLARSSTVLRSVCKLITALKNEP